MLSRVDAEQVADDAHRQRKREGPLQVDRLADRHAVVVGEAVEQLAGDLLDPGPQLFDPARGERGGRQAPQPSVVGAVDRHHAAGGVHRRGQRPAGGDLPALPGAPLVDVLHEPRVGQDGSGHLLPGDRPGVDPTGQLHRRDRARGEQPAAFGRAVGGLRVEHDPVRCVLGHRMPPENSLRRAGRPPATTDPSAGRVHAVGRADAAGRPAGRPVGRARRMVERRPSGRPLGARRRLAPTARAVRRPVRSSRQRAGAGDPGAVGDVGRRGGGSPPGQHGGVDPRGGGAALGGEQANRRTGGRAGSCGTR